MNEKDILHHIRAWKTATESCEQVMDQVAEIFGSSPESSIISAMYDALDMATEFLAMSTKTDRELLRSWWIDHNFGEKTMETYSSDGKRKIIKNEADFVRLLIQLRDEQL